MSLSSFLFGRKPQFKQFSQYGPGVQSALDQNILSGLQGMGAGKFDFAPIEAQARKNFSTQTIPSLAQRFTSMGEGAQSTGMFQNALGRAGADLENSLAALQSDYNLQQQGLLQQLLGQGRMENMYTPRTHGLLGEVAGPLTKMGLRMGNTAAMSHGLYGRGMMEGVQGLNGNGFDLSKLASLMMFL